MPQLQPGNQIGLRIGTFKSPQTTISNPFLFCQDYTIGGIKKIWLGSRSKFGKWRYTETANYQFGEVIGNSQNNAWYPLPVRKADSNFTIKQELTPARSYLITLTLNFNQMEILKRDAFERMAVSRDSMFIVSDYNGKFWLLGEENGMDSDLTGKSDNIRGLNDFTLTLTSRERSPVKEVDPEYVNQYVDIEIMTVCDYDFPEFCDLTFTQLKEIPFN